MAGDGLSMAGECGCGAIFFVDMDMKTLYKMCSMSRKAWTGVDDALRGEK